MLDSAEHLALVVRVLDLLHLDDLLLLQDLDGVEALVVLALDEVDATERAGTEGALDLEVGEVVFTLCNASLLRGRVLGEGVCALQGGMALVGICVCHDAVGGPVAGRSGIVGGRRG